MSVLPGEIFACKAAEPVSQPEGRPERRAL